ncbi:phage integrase SAM-like domain-containing protein [Limnohabitans sp. Rim8]|uniref:phage integrase SAM-like domain-containing protein n=1 Tax=Limnohabitans sp. Rim8 TaxID=1100718 RepID=UPI0026028A43|nr:phage integrase SAM-like domain-containing protein [Limnohabitans sp. Rim8]
MKLTSIRAKNLVSLVDFTSEPLQALSQSGYAPIAVLAEDKLLFYVVHPEEWDRLNSTDNVPPIKSIDVEFDAQMTGSAVKLKPLSPPVNKYINGKFFNINNNKEPKNIIDFEKQNNFNYLASELLDLEWDRVSRGEISASSTGIQKNRLDAHILPFFRYIPATQVTHQTLADFVSRLTKQNLSTTTISQYLVIVRKLLKLGVRKGFLKETPEMPKVKIAIQPRSMLSVLEYRKVCQAAHRLSHTRALAPPIKSTEGKRERFWVAPRNMFLPPDMGWAIRFMVNSFIRPGDLRELKHKHVNVVRGSSIYLRLKLPKTKKHDKQMVTLQPAVKVYEAARSHHTAEGYGGDEDYVFLPAEKDRNYALAVLGFWFKWCIREAGLSSNDELGQTRTLYCLRHTSLMFRLLYGQGIDMLTLARNARTSVQMIEKFYASSLDGEMNVRMLQSRRSLK